MAIRNWLYTKDLPDLKVFLSNYGYKEIEPKGKYEKIRFHCPKYDDIIIFFRGGHDDATDSLTVQSIDRPMMMAFTKWRKENARLHSVFGLHEVGKMPF